MKLRISTHALALTALAIASLAGCGSEAAPPLRGRTEAPSDVQRIGRCMNMGNALEADREGDWGYKVEDADLDLLARDGFEAIRLPVKWSAHAGKIAPYAIETAFFERIDHVIEAANKAGLRVVLNVHHYDELYADPAGHTDRFLALWRQIAAHYASAPSDKLIFEIINEPRDKLSGKTMSAVEAKALAEIRKTNPTRTVIVTGDEWGSVYGAEHLDLPSDRNIIMSVHHYEPHDFTHQGATWSDKPMPTGIRWGTARDRDELARFAQRMTDYARKHDIPVFLGEFGALRFADAEMRRDWVTSVRREAEARGIDWCYYEFAVDFGAYEKDGDGWKPVLLDALIEPKR